MPDKKIMSFPKFAIGNPHRLGTTIKRGSSIETLGDDSVFRVWGGRFGVRALAPLVVFN